MGACASLTLPPVRLGFSMMSVTFQSGDRITVLHLDDAGLSAVRQAINETWPSGIQHEQGSYGTGWSFKLHGYPFGNVGSSQIQARKILCQILQKLYAIGWKVIGCGNLGRNDYRSTIFFERSSPQFSTHPFVAVALQDSDKLKFVNIPVDLIIPIKEAINHSWSLGIQKEDLVDGILEVKLCGTPWRSSEEQSIMAKCLLQNIIAILHHYQYAYYCSVNFDMYDLHSLVFYYDPNVIYGENLSLCSISLKRRDRLRLINAPRETVAMVRKVIEVQWEPGRIQDERDYHGSWEFKLSGTPWWSRNDESARARYLVVKIIEGMQEQGWYNIAGINCSRRFNDKAVMIFQKGEPKPSPLMCLSLNDTDKMRLVNMSPQQVKLIKNLILSRWAKGIQAESQISLRFGEVYQLKLLGNPWTGGFNDDSIHGQSLLCSVFDELRQQGWKLLLSADISSKLFDEEHGIPMDGYSLWFIYEPSPTVQPSAPSYGTNFTTFGTQQLSAPLTCNDANITTFGTYEPIQTFPTASTYELAVFGTQSVSQPEEPPPSYMEAMAFGQTGKL